MLTGGVLRNFISKVLTTHNTTRWLTYTQQSKEKQKTKQKQGWFCQPGVSLCAAHKKM